jgi:hypothetical protein
MGTKSKSFALVLVVLFLMSLVVLPPATVKAQSKTIVVPDDCPTIQNAILNSSSGDTIFIRNGVYTVLGKFSRIGIDNTSLSLVGEDPNKTILKRLNLSDLTTPTIEVFNSNVSISGFTIANGGLGISIENPATSNYSVTITGNNIINNSVGINALNSYLFISQNNITGNDGCGIELSHSSGIIYRNYIADNTINIASPNSNNLLIEDNNKYVNTSMPLSTPQPTVFKDFVVLAIAVVILTLSLFIVAILLVRRYRKPILKTNRKFRKKA